MTAPSVAIVGYGMGNVTSLVNAFEAVGGAASVVDDAAVLRTASHVVLPGVGAFRKGMERLRENGFEDALRDRAEAGRPLLGICLGMQLLASEGDEHGPTKGLDLVAGRVVRMDRPGVRIPHMGWNDAVAERPSRLIGDAGATACYYFVHSYELVPERPEDVCLVVDHGGPVVAGVEHDNLFGVQFHPEKSHADGLALLRRFLDL